MSTQAKTPTKVEMPVPQTQPEPTPMPQAQPQTSPGQPAQEPPAYGRAGASLSGVYYDYGMQMCIAGRHDFHTNYGLGGILCAIFCFPCGLLGLCIDRDVICRRCGAQRL